MGRQVSAVQVPLPVNRENRRISGSPPGVPPPISPPNLPPVPPCPQADRENAIKILRAIINNACNLFLINIPRSFILFFLSMK